MSIDWFMYRYIHKSWTLVNFSTYPQLSTKRRRNLILNKDHLEYTTQTRCGENPALHLHLKIDYTTYSAIAVTLVLIASLLRDEKLFFI